MAPVLAAGGGLPGRRIAPTTAFVWLDDSYVTNGSRNVTALQDAAGFRVAGYTYGPFGQVLSMDGALAEVNPFRFSSEFHDDETGLVYYNYRYYSPSLGRWTKRAPIGEAGGLNSYVIVNNSIIDYWDNWGLVLYAFDGTGNYKNILGGVSAQPAPSGFEADSVVCSATNRNNGRMAWDGKDEIIGRRNCQNIGTAA